MNIRNMINTDLFKNYKVCSKDINDKILIDNLVDMLEMLVKSCKTTIGFY